MALRLLKAVGFKGQSFSCNSFTPFLNDNLLKISKRLAEDTQFFIPAMLVALNYKLIICI